MRSDSSEPDSSHGLTLRIRLPKGSKALARVVSAIARSGGKISSMDTVSATADTLTRDIVVSPTVERRGQRLLREIRGLPAVELLNVSDLTFLTHLGGKIEVSSKLPIRTPSDLSMFYTPGVTRVCRAVSQRPEKVWGLTSKRNLLAVVSDGSSVLGLGNIGPAGALPALEAKAQLFKLFGGVDAFPLCLDTQDPGEIIETIVRLAPSFGGFSLEGIASPRCFEVAEKVQALLDMPIYHDDQHGTAVVVHAALLNALRVTGRRLKDLSVVISGVGAAGVGVTRLLLHAGVRRIIGCDKAGAIFSGRQENMNPIKEWFAAHTNPGRFKGKAGQAARRADAFIGLSGPGSISAAELRGMSRDPIIFALATPTPEVSREQVPFAGVFATGLSDGPNYINNALAFPGFLRGCLDVRASAINLQMLAAAAHALAGTIPGRKLSRDYVIPSLFNTDVARNVAAAVWEAAHLSHVARRSASSDYHDGRF